MTRLLVSAGVTLWFVQRVYRVRESPLLSVPYADRRRSRVHKVEPDISISSSSDKRTLTDTVTTEGPGGHGEKRGVWIWDPRGRDSPRPGGPW